MTHSEQINEIAAASQEQDQGISQINKAVADMDKVTQQASASAEEAASTAEEMTSQAEQLRGYVRELVAVIGGNRSVPRISPASHAARGRQRSHQPSGRAALPWPEPARQQEKLQRH